MRKYVIEVDVPESFTDEEVKEAILDLVSLGLSKCAGATKDPIAIQNLKVKVLDVKPHGKKKTHA